MMRAVNVRKYVETLFDTNKLISQRYPHSKKSFNISRVAEVTKESEDSIESTFMTNQNLSKSNKLNRKQLNIEEFYKTRPRHIFEKNNIQCHETEKHIEKMKEIINLQHQEHQEMKRRLEILEGGAKIYFH